MAINLNPKIDVIFRKLFGIEASKDLLISLINSIVEPELRLTDWIRTNAIFMIGRSRKSC